MADGWNFSIRTLDLRPVIVKPDNSESGYYAGHYSSVPDVRDQGGSGRPIKKIITEINAFTAINPELVILNVSHDNNTERDWDNFSQDEWNELFELFDGLNCLYKAADGSTDLTTIQLNEFIGGDRAAVVIRFPFGVGDTTPNPPITLGSRSGNGFFYQASFPNYFDEYADTDNPN